MTPVAPVIATTKGRLIVSSSLVHACDVLEPTSAATAERRPAQYSIGTAILSAGLGTIAAT
jgi:hypothetical protein